MNDLEYYIKGGFFMGNKLNDTGLRIVWNKVWSLVKSITGDVNVTEKGTLQKQIDDLKTDCFQSVSDGKALVASAITDKGVTTALDATFATMAANIDAIETEMSLQSKSVSLSTSAQTVKPDSGYDGLSQVSVPAVTGTAEVGDVVVGKTFNSATAGIGKTGTLADKTGTADYSATASLDATNSRLKMKIPAQGKYGTGNYLYAAYSTIASLIGLTATKLVKGNTILGITGNSNNMDTSGGDATAAQILSGKKACVDGELRTGTMTNRQGTTVDATAVSQDDTYTYFTTPAGSYSTTSKVRTPNSNLGGKYFVVYNSAIESNIINSFIGKSIALIGQYPAYIGSANSGIKTNHYIVACDDGKGTTYVSEKAVDVTNKTALCISGRQSLGTSAQIKIGLSKTPNPSSLSDFAKTITVSNTTENVQFDVSDITGDYYLCFALYLSCHYRIDSIVLI